MAKPTVFDREARAAELKDRFLKEPCVVANKMEVQRLAYGQVLVIMPVAEEMTVLEGFANGAFIAAAMNTAGVYAAMSVIPEGHARLFGGNFRCISPAWKGKVLATAWFADETSRFVDIHVKAENESGELVASGFFTYCKPKPKG